MEFWDILDRNGNKTGKTVERGKPMRQDEYHLVVQVWINQKKYAEQSGQLQIRFNP